MLEPDGGTKIGPLPEQFGFEGPFDSAVDYFLAWCRHNQTSVSLHQIDKSDVDLIRSVERFPRRLESVIKSVLPPDISVPGYPIVHTDLGEHNLLFNDDHEIVGVIDWEYSFSAPMDVFASLTMSNMYVTLDSERVTQCWSDEGKYLLEVKACEENFTQKLSTKFGTLLGDLGYFMYLFQEGKTWHYDILLDRAEALSKSQAQ